MLCLCICMYCVVVAIVIVKLIKKSNTTCALSSTNGVFALLQMAVELCVLVLLCYHGLGQAKFNTPFLACWGEGGGRGGR